MPVDVLRGAMSSVHDRLAECEQRNGGHLEDVIFRVELCVSRPLIHLFLQMLKYVQGGSNMTGTDLYVNKPHCAAAVRP